MSIARKTVATFLAIVMCCSLTSNLAFAEIGDTEAESHSDTTQNQIDQTPEVSQDGTGSDLDGIGLSPDETKSQDAKG
jgi:hypothetical protein